MVKVTMAHLLLLRFAILLAVSASIVQSQLFVRSPIRPVYFFHRANNNNNRNVQANLEERVPYANARSDLVSSEEDQNEGDAGFSEGSFEKRNETQLSDDFDRSVRDNRPPLEPRRNPPMYGDPAVMEDEDAEQDRSRFLWPFSTTVTVSKSKAHPPHHHHPLSYPPGFPKPPLLPPHLQHQHHHDHHSDLEYEKTRLKYEIYKLKAKKTIAILQNKVELKKILSLLLQQKIKALEWITWYHDYVEQMYNQANGWDSGDGEGWDGQIEPLTDEEILHSKGSSSSSPKSSKWSSYFGGRILSHLRSSINFAKTTNNAANKQEVLPPHIIPQQKYHPPQHQVPPQPQQQLQRVSIHSQHQQQPLPPPKPTIALQQKNPHEQKKPLLQNLLGRSTLLKYLGLGKKQKAEAIQKPHEVQDVLLRNEKPPSQEQSEEQEDQNENVSPEDQDYVKEEEDDNDDDDDVDENKNDKSEDDENETLNNKSEDDENETSNNKSEERDNSLEPENAEKSQEVEIEKSLEQENEKSKEQENGESTEKEKLSEEDVTDGKSSEGESNKSDEENVENNTFNTKDALKIDIDEELADIEVPTKVNRLRTGNQPSTALKSNVFPNKKEKKKKKFQDKVYSFLFKTMDVLDKHFMSDDEEEVLEA